MKVHLGIVDTLYENGTPSAKVARILEGKYGIMDTFAQKNLQFIADQLAQSLTDNLEQILKLGAKAPNTNVYAQGNSNIEQKFREFLNRNGTGIITKASTIGTSGRFKDVHNRKGKRKVDPNLRTGQVRPSFIDTGLYQQSMRCWVEED
jgi:hypothetical protein